MKRLSCRSCGSNLNIETFNPKFAVVNCSHCGSTYDASDLTGNTSETLRVRKPGANYPKPESIRQKNSTEGTTFSWRAHNPITSLLSIPINVFVLSKVSESFLPRFIDGFSWHDGNPAEFGFINWVLIALGLWISSIFIFNRHRIRLTKNSLMIDQQPVPVPWRFRKSIPRDVISQLFVAERVVHKKNGPSTTYYILRLIDANNTLVEIPGRFRSPEEAIYIEHALEEELDLSNIRIAGEIGR